MMYVCMSVCLRLNNSKMAEPIGLKLIVCLLLGPGMVLGYKKTSVLSNVLLRSNYTFWQNINNELRWLGGAEGTRTIGQPRTIDQPLHLRTIGQPGQLTNPDN